jgi:hypothetical protein
LPQQVGAAEVRERVFGIAAERGSAKESPLGADVPLKPTSAAAAS